MTYNSGVPKEKLLFVCTANVSRSPMAAHLFDGAARFEARSAGTDGGTWGRTQVTQDLVDWADRIFVMSEEDGHLSFLRERFDLGGKPVEVLGVANDYDMSPARQLALEAALRAALARHFDLANL